MAEWDNAHFLTKGADLSATFGSYATLIEQAIEQAVPASTWYGGVIESTDTPPVTGALAFNKRCIWHSLGDDRLYYYDNTAGSWEHLENLLDLISLIGTGDITLQMIDASTAAARYVLRRNSANTANEWVAPTSLFNAGEIAWSRLAAGTSGDVLYFGGSGWTTTNLDAFVRVIVNDEPLPVGNLYATASDMSDEYMVPTFATLPGFVSFEYADQLLRTNKVTTNKLLFTAGSAGKYAKVNAGGTDFEYDSGPTPATATVATLVDTGVSGTAAQIIGAATPTQVRLASEIAASWCTVAANAFTLTAGTYVIHASIPVWFSGSTTGKGYIELVEGASTTRKTANVTVQDDDNTVAQLHYVLVPTVSTTYKFNVYINCAGSLGLANSIASVPEVYTQVTILKIA